MQHYVQIVNNDRHYAMNCIINWQKQLESELSFQTRGEEWFIHVALVTALPVPGYKRDNGGWSEVL